MGCIIAFHDEWVFFLPFLAFQSVTISAMSSFYNGVLSVFLCSSDLCVAYILYKYIFLFLFYFFFFHVMDMI